MATTRKPRSRAARGAQINNQQVTEQVPAEQVPDTPAPAKRTRKASTTKKAPTKKVAEPNGRKRKEPGKLTRHIDEVFRGKKAGTFLTVSEIDKVVTEAYPGDARPGGGNLGKVIRLYAATMLPAGVEPATGGPRNAQGLRKVRK